MDITISFLLVPAGMLPGSACDYISPQAGEASRPGFGKRIMRFSAVNTSFL